MLNRRLALLWPAVCMLHAPTTTKNVATHADGISTEGLFSLALTGLSGLLACGGYASPVLFAELLPDGVRSASL